MRTPSLLTVLLLVALAASAHAQEHHRFLADDEVEVHAYLYAPERVSHNLTILAFHQAQGDARGEYGPIAERLVELGHEVMTVDLRSGGDRFGGENQTVRDLGRSTGYCEAMPDLEAAYSYLHSIRPQRPIVILGSSYSAALVLRLAAENPPNLAGVIPFSPASGGPMEACRGEEVSEQIEAPVLVFRPASEMKIESVQKQAEVFEKQGHEVHVSDPGVHGASMLVEERVDARVEATWSKLIEFLRQAERRATD